MGDTEAPTILGETELRRTIKLCCKFQEKGLMLPPQPIDPFVVRELLSELDEFRAAKPERKP